MAAGDHDPRLGIAPQGLADELPRLLSGPGGHGAGVDDVDIGLGLKRNQGAALLGKTGGKGGGFELVDLAAQSGNGDPFHAPASGAIEVVRPMTALPTTRSSR